MEQSLLFSLSIYAQFTDFSMSGEILKGMKLHCLKLVLKV